MLKLLAGKKPRPEQVLSKVLVATGYLEALLKQSFKFDPLVEVRVSEREDVYELVIWDLDRPAFIESIRIDPREFADFDQMRMVRFAWEIGWKYVRTQDAWQGGHPLVWC